MTFLRPGLGKLIGRALRLHCPHCGGSDLFVSFFKLKEHCPTCGLRLERGEGDYFVGAYMINLIVAELVLFVCVCGFVYLTWPNPPWEIITYVTAVLMLSGIVLCYPFSKTTWLAVDIAIRPLSPEELNWHKSSGDVGERELPHL